MERTSGGFALVLALAVLLALTALFHGSLVLARSRLTAARASEERLRLRLAAEGALRIASRRLPPADRERETGTWLPVDGPRRLAVDVSRAADARVEVRLLSAEWRWLEATAFARAPGSGPSARIGRVLWILDPRVRARAATTDMGTGASDPGGGDGPGEPRGLEGVPSLGLLDGAELARRAGEIVGDARVVGSSRAEGEVACPPVPARSSGSTADTSSSSATGADPVLRVRDGDLKLAKVRWEGVLVVGGELVLTADARIDGLVLVAGGIDLRRGGCVRGAVRAAGGLRAEPGAHLLTSADVVEEVLRRVPGLSDPLPAAPSSWISLD